MRTLSGYLTFWFVLLVLAIGNGILREAAFAHRLPELAAHQVSTVTAMLATGAAVWLFAVLWRAPASAREALAIGAAWVVCTVAFEFAFGRWVVGHSWERLLQDYDLSAGRVWSVFLLWLLVLPLVVFRLRARRG